MAGLAEHTVSPGDRDVTVDVGRLGEASPAWRLATSADTLLGVSGTDVASLDHTAALTSQHTELARMSVALVVPGEVGSRVDQQVSG